MLKTKDGIHPTAHYQVISYDAARNPAILRAILKYDWDVLVVRRSAQDEKYRRDHDARDPWATLKGSIDHGGEKLPAIASKAKYKLALTGTLLLEPAERVLRSVSSFRS
jgi:hypothetical protein